MKNQEVFNRVWNHFVVVNKTLAKTKSGDTHYKNTVDCPVGILMSELIYDVEMEGLSFLMVCKEFPKVLEYFKGVDVWFLCKIQEVHDTSNTIEEFEAELREVAKDYKLQIPRVELAV